MMSRSGKSWSRDSAKCQSNDDPDATHLDDRLNQFLDRKKWKWPSQDVIAPILFGQGEEENDYDRTAFRKTGNYKEN